MVLALALDIHRKLLSQQATTPLSQGLRRRCLCLHPRSCSQQGATPMKPLHLSSLIAALVLTLPVAFAQTTDPGAKQDIKNAGSDTKHAATSAGHSVSQGSKTAYHKTAAGTEKGYDKTKSGTEKGYDKAKSGTETGYHKTAHATKTGVHKVEGKPDTPANNPPQ
jgi:hypothetical protein